MVVLFSMWESVDLKHLILQRSVFDDEGNLLDEKAVGVLDRQPTTGSTRSR
jgi:hypothetical protein